MNMPSLKQAEEAGSLFFLTIKTINGLPVLINKDYYDVIIDSLNFCRNHKDWGIYAYTILINHLHLLLSIKKEDSLWNTIGDFKSYTAHEILKLLKRDKQYDILAEMRIAAYKSNDRDNKIWRKNCWPEIIISDKFFWQKVDYIDFNAWQHGIVKDIENYIYTSYHNHYCKHNVILKIDNIEELF